MLYYPVESPGRQMWCSRNAENESDRSEEVFRLFPTQLNSWQQASDSFCLREYPEKNWTTKFRIISYKKAERGFRCLQLSQVFLTCLRIKFTLLDTNPAPLHKYQTLLLAGTTVSYTESRSHPVSEHVQVSGFFPLVLWATKPECTLHPWYRSWWW